MNACTACGRSAATARVESTHRTSDGVVRYLRCPCGHRRVEQARLVLVAVQQHGTTAAAAVDADG